VFTGLVEDLGTVAAIRREDEAAELRIQTRFASEVAVGDSVAVDGVCLTTTAKGQDTLLFTAVAETLARSTLGGYEVGTRCNLERPLRMTDRLGGHLVQGHVDAVGRIESRVSKGESIEMRFSAPEHVLRYVVEKGSIAVDGISLTVMSIDAKSFEIALIPHTLAVTTLGVKPDGAPVNLEVDMVAKYVEKLLLPHAAASGITMEFLKKHGFA